MNSVAMTISVTRTRIRRPFANVVARAHERRATTKPGSSWHTLEWGTLVMGIAGNLSEPARPGRPLCFATYPIIVNRHPQN
jgi:hypothetical protein